MAHAEPFPLPPMADFDAMPLPPPAGAIVLPLELELERAAHAVESIIGTDRGTVGDKWALAASVYRQMAKEYNEYNSSQQRLPDSIRQMVYRACCCVSDPVKAQKEPCACIAAAICDQAEDWAAAQVTKHTKCAECQCKLTGVCSSCERGDIVPQVPRGWAEGGE